MRLLFLRRLWALALMLAVVPAEPVRAQSIFEGIIGLFGNKSSRQTSYRSTPISPPPAEAQPWSYNLSPADPQALNQSTAPGSYRTVCVRTCDGFYFPIRGGTTRATFRRDADACAAACGSEARLFYGSRSTSSAHDLVDLEGRAYSDMKTAFLYRKKLVDGCACRPMPWSAAERARHLRYAYAEELQRLEERRVAAAAEAMKAAAAARIAAATMGEPAAGTASVAAATAGSVVTALPDALETASASPDDVAPHYDQRSARLVPGTQSNSGGVRFSPRVAGSAPARPIRRPAAVHKAKSSGGSSFSLFTGGGQPKYRWPGDR